MIVLAGSTLGLELLKTHQNGDSVGVERSCTFDQSMLVGGKKPKRSGLHFSPPLIFKKGGVGCPENDKP